MSSSAAYQWFQCRAADSLLDIGSSLPLGRPAVRTLLLSGLTILAVVYLLGCESTTPRTTNKVTKAEAIQIASQLVYDMPDSAAVLLLREHGLAMDRPGAGDSFGWSLGFSLSDGGTLVLEIHPKPVSPDGAWVNGRVTAAHISNWNCDVVAKLKLRNPP